MPKKHGIRQHSVAFILDPNNPEEWLELSEKQREHITSILQGDHNSPYREFLQGLVTKTGNESVAEIESSTSQVLYVLSIVGELNYYLDKIKGNEERSRALVCSEKLLNFALEKSRELPIKSPNAMKYFWTQQAKIARDKRPERPEEQALQAAIEVELGGRVVTRAYKEALAMLPAVNRRLLDSGFSPVKVGKVERRLKQKTSFLKSGEEASE